ncbi:DUF1963 domain-containing protein [Actinomadura namibiensis]|uniref:DUF1963 domain-containing protein n=1 Tax=Actinomadura namibiensis TaxID=182080 RepID=A0A7W3M0A0_ACTNM|nr:DUF1963 domain-containing protein [Actinomadura namibiensis]MBA8957435.1 hypothetical protein [Actinomadura namibiensis]
MTTPSKPVDIAAVFPELAAYARTTVRLHPRPGAVGVHDSSVGGPLLWPADEPWPVCEGFRMDSGHEGQPWHREPVALVAAAQLYQRDVPELPFFPDADVLQLLWCPIPHATFYPEVSVRWRLAEEVDHPLSDIPAPSPGSQEDFLLRPCTVSPERVVEYPHPEDLPEQLRERLYAWGRTGRWSYFYHLSVAPGTKVGGWIRFAQDPLWQRCYQGHLTDHLLTIATSESEGGSHQTWDPVEEPERRPGAVTGLRVGDAGSLFVAICHECWGRPVLSWSDG